MKTSNPGKISKFQINNKIWVSKVKKVFDRRYTPNWSIEIFTVAKVCKTNPVTHHFKNYQDQSVSDGFYEHDLLKVEYPDAYLIEKVLKEQEIKFIWNG